LNIACVGGSLTNAITQWNGMGGVVEWEAILVAVFAYACDCHAVCTTYIIVLALSFTSATTFQQVIPPASRSL
jgi:hypothetical protein